MIDRCKRGAGAARLSRRQRAVASAAKPQVERLEPRQLLSGDGRPTATLDAAPILLWGSTYSFRVTYSDNISVNPATLDSNDLTISGPNGFSRTARFYRSEIAHGGRTAYAWYKISAPGGVWDAADNGAYSISINPHQVRDHEGNSARAVRIGAFRVDVPPYPSTVAATMATKGIIGVDVTRFGAKPDDGIDDTDAIQRAIDSLPRGGDGVPNAQQVMGGTVVFPSGTFNTSRPLRIPAAVRVRGQGAQTLIASSSASSSEGVFEFYSYSGHGFNIRAGIENLTITSVAAKGIKATRMDGDLLGLRLNDLTISTGGVAIDLREERTYAAELRNITIENPGSTALWLGPSNDGWISNVNHISGFRVVGTARPDFRGERALVVLGGDVTVDGLSIDDIGVPVTPLYGTGWQTFTRLQILGTGHAPGGLLATFENAVGVEIDRITLAADRRLELRNTRNLNVASLRLAPGAQLIDSIVLDGSSNLTVETLRSAGSPGPLTDPRLVVRRQRALDAEAVFTFAYEEPKRPVSQTVVDVTRFGAVPNDGIDDTAAIQAAIDALPKGSGIPGVGSEYTGGLVLLPAGRLDTSAPLLLPSGVWLRGQGNGTVLYNSSGDVSRGALEFVGHPAHGFNAGAAIEDLSIYTTTGLGIRGNATITAGLIDARISGVQISAGFRAIDFSEVRAYHTQISNVMVSIPGSTALWLGDSDGYSADNRVIGFTLYGGARPNFRAERALVVLGGDTYFQNGWIEHPSTRVLPLHVSGAATIRGLWLEYAPEKLPNRIVAQFQDTTRIDVDRLMHVSAVQQLNLVNARGVRINLLNLDGYTHTLRDSVAVDGHSRLTIGLVNTQRDAGLLDHPRVRVEAVYNNLDRMLIQNRPPAATDNLIKDPLFRAFVEREDNGSKLGGSASIGWYISWGDTQGEVHGTATLEQRPNGPRLKVVITSNPNNRPVYIVGRLNIAPALVGRHAVAWWRMDGPRQVVAYLSDEQREFSARAMNGLTSSRTSSPLRADDQIVFVLPPQPGTYYLSNVALVPV